MGYRGTRRKTLMCSALVQIIHVDHDSDTSVVNKYSKWVSLKLHALKLQENKFSGKSLIKRTDKVMYNYVHLYYYNKQRILLHVSAFCHGYRQGGVL